MKSHQHINTFLDALEEDLSPSILVFGDVDQTVLSNHHPNLAQLWRLIHVVRVQLLDLKEYIERRDEKMMMDKKKEEEQLEEKSPAPKKRKPRKKKDVPSVDEM